MSVDLKNVNFASSVQVQLYSGDALLTTATLQGVTPGSYDFLTCCIATETADANWALTPWTPKDDVVPNKAVLFVDGDEQDTKTFTLNADEWAKLPGTAFPDSSIERVGITHDNGTLKNAVSVDLKNVNFASSVQVQLYRDETLLTTATLQGVNPGSYDFLTCCIATETADANWALTPWTPKDDVVPDKAVLFVDGYEQDTKTFTLNAKDWANLPGTAFSYSGSIERVGITHDNGVLKNAVSVDLKNVNFESSVQVQLYSGDALLTTATLQGVNPGSHGFLTCCIATETADANWALTPWTPKDNIVPNKAVLVVDGHEQETNTFTLNAEDWANLPGTVLPDSIERVGITHDNGVLKNAVSVDLKNVNFASSVQVQLYSGETLLTTATLQGVKPGSHGFLTCCIATETADANWALTPWTPKDDVVPNKAVLFVDGHEQDTKTFTLDAKDWAKLPGTAFPYSGSIERVGITHDNGVLKNAVSVDLKNVNFESSVQVQLYSGDALLTTATLQGVNPGSHGFLTCCIATETADEYWSLTPWTPKDDVVPNKAVLVVDGHEQDTKTFTLNAENWANLPGTALPDSSIEHVGITHDNGVLKNAVSVDLKNVNFESSVQVQLYSGDALLTTATLQGVNPGSHGFLTCCIATETADEYWPLTPWTPKDDVVPNKVVLFVDDKEMDTMEFTLDAAEWAALPGTALPDSSIERVGITHDNGVLKNAVSVDLKNVNFASSVQVQLYSGDALLTTATLNTDKLGAGSYPYLTCCIATGTPDEYWSLTPWTPKDNVVPNKVVLFVDDKEMDTMEFTLDVAEWKALPGTVLPYSGSIERVGITHANGVLKNAVSVDLKNVNFESSVQVQLYRDDTPLTTATLNTDKLKAGSYPYLTCCIATETADEYWSLTSWTPQDDVVPNKAALFVDGYEQDTKTFTLDADEWAKLPGTAFPCSGSIERVGITHANGVLKDAVSVDLKNVNFESSVQVKLYSGKTLLTTATLNTDKLGAGSYPYLTCCIATKTADEYWKLTYWTPKDNIVPNKAVLVVDGHELDTKTFKLNAKEWADLPGTVRPSSNNDELDDVPKTGDTINLALWIAMLFVSGGAAIGTTVVSSKKTYNR